MNWILTELRFMDLLKLYTRNTLLRPGRSCTMCEAERLHKSWLDVCLLP